MKVKAAENAICPFVKPVVDYPEQSWLCCNSLSCMAWVKTGECDGYCSLIPGQKLDSELTADLRDADDQLELCKDQYLKVCVKCARAELLSEELEGKLTLARKEITDLARDKDELISRSWAALDAEEAKGLWVSVKERLPEAGEYVLTYGINGHMLARCGAVSRSWHTEDGKFLSVAFWQPLTFPEVIAYD